MDEDITKVRRHPERASYDRNLLLDILGNNFVCQVGFEIGGQPFVIPMAYYNDEENIYLHGSVSARIAGHIRSGNRIAISILEINGLVIAKGLADNSINYRSAIIFGRGEEILDEREKLRMFVEWLDWLIPGRSRDTELPGESDLRNVSVFKVPIEEFSIKTREGGPMEKNRNPGIWSGVIPIFIVYSRPMFSDGETPRYIEEFIERRNKGLWGSP
ncbi:MAG: pyridoxamine 5'-phosphate oxidase family protein [Thermoplasmata archaeon]